VEKRTAYLLAGGAAAGFVAWWLLGQSDDGGAIGEASQLLNDALNAIVKGAKLTHAPYDKTTGVVPGSPAELAAQAGVDVEVYSLARMIASEEGRSSNVIKAAVAFAAINRATSKGEGITALVTRALVPSHSGSYGTQRNIDPNKGGDPENGPSDRYCSTANDPYAGDADIAGQCYTGVLDDFTGGAVEFDRPGQERDPEKVAADRAAEGLVALTVPGIDVEADGIRFWGRG
jgi:hypothetical protein